MHTDKNFLRKIAPLGAKASAEFQKQRAIENYKKIDPHCQWCKQPIPPPEVKKHMSWARASKRKFCSFSCAQKNSWNNREARLNKVFNFITTGITLGELKVRRKGHKAWRHGICLNAQKIYKRGKLKLVCERCGYDKHIEVCHKKAVADFSDTALVSDINHPDNLVGLCPNCHWELDNQQLFISNSL